MTKLNSEARRVLADAGITVRDWITYGGWLTAVTDEAGDSRRIPETEWRGDECGCTDDRCIGYHHDEHEECGCLPALIQERTKAREAYDIVWQPCPIDSHTRFFAHILPESGEVGADVAHAALLREVTHQLGTRINPMPKEK